MHFPRNRDGDCAFNATNVVADLLGFPRVRQADVYAERPPDGRMWLEPPQVLALMPQRAGARLCMLDGGEGAPHAWPVSEFTDVGVGYRCFVRPEEAFAPVKTPQFLWKANCHHDVVEFVRQEVIPTLRRGMPFIFDDGLHVRTLFATAPSCWYLYDDLTASRVAPVRDIAGLLASSGQTLLGIAGGPNDRNGDERMRRMRMAVQNLS